MRGSMLRDAGTLLQGYIGTAREFGPRYRWPTLVRVACAANRPGLRISVRSSRSDDGPLHSARETAEARTAGIAEYLKSNGQSSRSARALHSLADWWLQDSGRDSESPLAWERPAEAFREELRALPGVSLTLADRILLFVGGLPVFPVDRAALRIACRHGWMEQTAEYDEWQSFFTRESAEARIQLTDLAHWLSAIGGEFCGAKPQCEQCPLRALLPACGPVPLTEGDQDV